MAQLMLKVDKSKYAKKDLKYDPEVLEKKDSRMRFNNSRDPIYYAFELIERRSVATLVGDLIEDSCFEINKTIKKVLNQNVKACFKR